MARTELFAGIRRAMAIAAAARRVGAPPIDELSDPGLAIARRAVLGGMIGAGLLPALPALALTRSDARIAIVAAGSPG